MHRMDWKKKQSKNKIKIKIDRTNRKSFSQKRKMDNETNRPFVLKK
jgi:hypothetical protein